MFQTVNFIRNIFFYVTKISTFGLCYSGIFGNIRETVNTKNNKLLMANTPNKKQAKDRTTVLVAVTFEKSILARLKAYKTDSGSLHEQDIIRIAVSQFLKKSGY